MNWFAHKWRDPKLEAVLARLCERRGDLWTTQAVKLPYLVDLIAQHVLGEPVTRSLHKAWKYGVVTARAWGMITKAGGGDHFKVYGDPYADGARLSLDSVPDEELTPEEQRIVDFVASEFGDIPSGELAQLTKDLNPDVKKWGSYDPVPLSKAAYKRLPIWFGEDEADAEFASIRLKEILENPRRMVSAEGFLQELAS
jgi:hypothetical protein